MNCAKFFRFEFFTALQCLADSDDRLKDELAYFLALKVCIVWSTFTACLKVLSSLFLKEKIFLSRHFYTVTLFKTVKC